MDKLRSFYFPAHAKRLAPHLILLPGGSRGSTLLHVARTVTRRAERSAWAAAGEHGDSMSPWPARYLNRLSDLLFILSRVANAGHGDVLWKPGGDRG